MLVDDLNADFKAADFDESESKGEMFILLPMFGMFGKIPSTMRLTY